MYSYWKDGDGSDMYYEVDRKTQNQTILKNDVAEK